MKTALQRRARELGFDLCRVTTADPPAGARHLRAWLDAGCHATMGWLARNPERRADPRQVLPGARSVITLAVSYHAPPAESAPPANAPAGGVARYARYADYHDALAGPLRELTAWVDRTGGPGTRSLWYVDTGPILERELARRAGVGFIGKHTNLVSRALGNWFFLAEILTTLELPPDPPERNHCGACARCLAACPTGALTAPFRLDARRCVSFLTIELKGSIPEALRPAIGTRIFGCDDCLAVCPWNRFAREARLMAAHRRPDLDRPALRELLALDAAAFKRRFAGTPILRTKRRGLLRNVAVALGNVGGPDDLPALRRAAEDPEPLIAEHAAWAAARVRARAAKHRDRPPDGG